MFLAQYFVLIFHVTSNGLFAGGGLGGMKESGQLRFGGRERPFRAPLYDHMMPSIFAYPT
jgi:hypothetical protein